MISNYYTFLFLVSTFNSSIVGKRVREVYSQDADEISVAFDDDPRQLVCLCRPDLSVAYLHDGRTRARRNSVDLLGGSLGARVTGATISPSDRILHFPLDNGTTITAVLFGSQANVLLLDESGIVLDAFKNPKKLRGSPSHFPPVAVLDGFQAFRTECASPEPRTVVSIIRKSFPVIGHTLALESVNRAGIAPAVKSDALDPGGVLEVENGIRSVFADIQTPVPRVYVSAGGVPEYFSLIPLRIAAGMKEETFSDIHRAIRSFIAGRGSKTEHDKEKDSLVAPIRQQIEKGRRTLRAIASDAREAERAGTYEAFGAALMAGLPDLRKGSSSFDAEVGGEMVSIRSSPHSPPYRTHSGTSKKPNGRESPARRPPVE